LQGMFITLITRGFCCPEQEDGASSADGQASVKDDVAGTGMGDAEGKKDVSDQIEDEEQLMGTTQEEKEDKPNLPKDQEEEEEGFDMEQDFDGTIESMPDKTVCLLYYLIFFFLLLLTF
jgi:midasin (ATPase involved in ribosome maturation)